MSLLADCDPDLPESSHILVVVAGIPYEYHSHLERDKIKTISDLISKINLLDSLSPRKNFKDSFSESRSFRNKDFAQKTCSYCESIGKPWRFHLESDCRTKKFRSNNNNISNNSNNTIFNRTPPKTIAQKNQKEEKSFKFTNNTELKDLLNNEI